MAFSLEAIFGVDASGVRAEVKSLSKEFNSFVQNTAKLGAGLAVAAFVGLSKGAVELAGKLSDTAQNIGINVESLQALEAQHKRNGVSSETLTKALEKTKSSVIAAAQGDEKAAEALAKLGLKAQDLIRLPLDQQYAAIASGARHAADENEAYSAVTSLLGEKVGPKLMGSLKELADVGLPGVVNSAKEAGQVMSAETIVALDRAGDAIDDFKKKATIAVGNILVDFRSEAGLELLGLKLMKVAGEFGGMLLDFFAEAGQFAYATLKGTFFGVLNFFQDKFVDVVQGIAGLINKVLPSKFEINVGNLDAFRSSGKGIGEEITEAIARTSPTTFKKDFSESWGRAVADQQKIVDAVNQIDLGDEADKLRQAGEAAKTSIADGGKKAAEKIVAAAPAIAEAGEKAGQSLIEAGSIAARDMKNAFLSVSRVGKNYADQSDASLMGVRANLTGQLNTVGQSGLLIKDVNQSTNYGDYAAASVLKGELAAVEAELAQRDQVRRVVNLYGENAARQQFGDTVTDKALRDMQASSTRTATAVESLNANLKNLNARLGVPTA